MNTNLLRLFTAAVVLAGVASVGLLPTEGLSAAAATLAVLMVLSVVVGSLSVRIPGTGLSVTATDVFVFVALAGETAIAAPLVAAAGTLGTEILSKRRRSLLRAVFNVATVPAAASAASWLSVLALRSPETLSLDRSVVVLVGAVLYLAVNLLLVASAVALEGRRGFLATVAAAGPWTLVSVLASAFVALGLGTLSQSLGAAAPFLGLALVPLITAYFRVEAQESVIPPRASELRVAATGSPAC